MPPGTRTLRDLDQPFVFELRGRRGRRFRLEFRDPDGPGDWRLLRPDLVLVCYDIGRRATLARLLTVVSLCADGVFFSPCCLFIYLGHGSCRYRRNFYVVVASPILHLSLIPAYTERNAFPPHYIPSIFPLTLSDDEK